MSSSSQDPKPVGTGKPVAVFSSQSRLNQDTFSEAEQPVDVVFGSDEPIFRFSNPTSVAKSLFLMEIEVTCLLKRDLNT